MNPSTIATLAELDALEWFTAVGKKDTMNAIVVSSWSEAIKHCRSPQWQDLLLEAHNQYFNQVRQRDKARASQWNTVVREVKQATVPLVERKTQAVIAANALPDIFLQTVQWDILHLGLEAEFADVYPPGFFASQAYWYLHGHFPCGWQGNFPDGMLIIY